MAPRTLAELKAEHSPPPRSRLHWTPGEEKESSPVRNYIRDLILGFNDGLVSVYAVVAGVVGAAFSTSAIAIAGLAAATAGALSMGLGEYLSTKSQAEFYEHERRLEARHIREFPELEKEELRGLLQQRGIPEPLARQVVDEAATDPERMLDIMMRAEFGTGEETMRSPWVAMGVVMVAFVVGAGLPVAPFLFPVAADAGFLFASVLAVAGLFAAGAGKAGVSGMNLWRGGAEMVALGAVAAAITFGVGRLVGLAI